MTRINLNSLNKSDWKPYRFDEIAKNISDRVDPTTTDLKVYIGLEHLDAESIHIKRTGTPDEVKGQKLKGYPGDIIFGKRRAYQRKAALLTEESVCSAHAFILRANPEVIEPKLFPFFLHSDMFMHRAVDISVGGLSPTINWGTLKSQEFLLPPKDQQADLAELLWAMDEVIEKELTLLDDLENYSENLQMKKFSQLWKDVKKGKLKAPNLEDLITTPVNNGIFKKREGFGRGTLLINVTDVYKSFRVKPSTLDRVDANDKEKVSFSAFPGDVIFNRSSLVKEGVGHTCLVPDYPEDMVFECHLMRVRPYNKKLNSSYLTRYCLSPFGRNYLISRSQTTTMTTLNQTGLNKMPIPLPSPEEQCTFSEILDSIDDSKELVTQKIYSSKSLKKSLINQVF